MLDLTDSVTPTVQRVVATGTTTGLGPGNAALAAMLTVSPASIAADTGDANNLGWDVRLRAARRSTTSTTARALTLTYTVRATDDNGGLRRSDRRRSRSPAPTTGR